MKRNDMLMLGGAAVVGYLILRSTEAGVSGVAGQLAGIPGSIAGIPQAIGEAVAGVPAGIGEAVGGAVGGAVGVIPEFGGGILQGLGEALAPPLRTFEPVPEVRDIPVSEQIGWTEYPPVPAAEYEQEKRDILAARGAGIYQPTASERAIQQSVPGGIVTPEYAASRGVTLVPGARVQEILPSGRILQIFRR